MVNIYMQHSNNEWIRALSIPPEDITRLSLRPLKWLRFVAFAAFGAKGDLLDGPGPGSSIVKYETVSHAELAESYYYFVPDGIYRLADPHGLNDCVTSSATLIRLPTFCAHVGQRDGKCCAITRAASDICHAAHIIPYAKTDHYIKLVVSDRRSLYEDKKSHLESIGIDSTENGIFLRTDLHQRFGLGETAFLKTPNFALSATDIPRVEPGETPASRTTIQHLIPYDETERAQILQWDVVADWSREDAPPTLLLDYVYGVAAIRCWAATDIEDMLESRHENYKKISSTPSPESSGDVDTVGDYEPPKSRREIHHESMEEERCRAIDFAFQFSMLFRGYPPGTTSQMLRQRQEEEAEMRSRQISREKVHGWLETDASLPPSRTNN